MKKIFLVGIIGLAALTPWCYAMGHRSANTDANANQNINSSIPANADINAAVKTDMHGNTSTNTGVAISSTAASSEGGVNGSH